MTVTDFPETALERPVTVDDVLHRIAGQLCDLLDAFRYTVHLRGDDGLFAGRVGFLGRPADEEARLLVTGHDPLTREAVQSGRPVVDHTGGGLPPSMAHWELDLAVPLAWAGDVIAVAYLGGRWQRHSRGELRAAALFADAAATSVGLALERSAGEAKLLPAESSEPGVVELLLRVVPRQEATQFAAGLLGPLLGGHGQTRTELLQTLRQYLESGAEVRVTARRLGVHENTVRYRLSRIRALCAGNPDDLGWLLDARYALGVLDRWGLPPDEATH
jgi:hypothetical protein